MGSHLKSSKNKRYGSASGSQLYLYIGLTLEQDLFGVFPRNEMEQVRDSVVNAIAAGRHVCKVPSLGCAAWDRIDQAASRRRCRGKHWWSEVRLRRRDLWQPGKSRSELLGGAEGNDRRQDAKKRWISVAAGRHSKHQFHELFGLQEDAVMLQVVLKVFIVGLPLIACDFSDIVRPLQSYVSEMY